MRPSARLQAVIELLDAITASWSSARPLPADLLLKRYLQIRRYAGAKDRRYIGDTLFGIFRRYGALSWHLERQGHAAAGRALAVAALLLMERKTPEEARALFDGGQYSPASLTPQERQLVEMLALTELHPPGIPDWARLNYPAWMEASLKESFGTDFEREMEALQREAPADLRVNTLKATRGETLAALRREGVESAPTALSPLGVRLAGRVNLSALSVFRDGWCEAQDEGAQLAALLLDAQPEETVIDYCAGAGGKALALAAAMRNRGRIIACDTDADRLKQLAPRARRAGASIVVPCLIGQDDTMLNDFIGRADRVLVDAPCSGTGTWRRQPDARWRITEEKLQRHIAAQRDILESAMRFLKPGGTLLYVTCSLLPEENEMQMRWLNAQQPKLKLVTPEKIWNKVVAADIATPCGSYMKLTPYTAGSDGFFAARFVHRG